MAYAFQNPFIGVIWFAKRELAWFNEGKFTKKAETYKILT